VWNSLLASSKGDFRPQSRPFDLAEWRVMGNGLRQRQMSCDLARERQGPVLPCSLFYTAAHSIS
jgi:hypothetical protein